MDTNKTLTLEELKAKAYDCLIQIEAWQKNLAAVNEAINNYKYPLPGDGVGERNEDNTSVIKKKGK